MKNIFYDFDYKMNNFFVENGSLKGDEYLITDGNFRHLADVLRMKVGENIFVSCDGKTDLCRIEKIDSAFAVAKIIEKNAIDTELPVELTLFQGLPKGDKMELIIQKCVELGVHRIVPVQMKRSVVKFDEKRKKSKTVRWQAIAESAAKQSKRNIIPEVSETIGFFDALEEAKKEDLILIPYENERGMADTKAALEKLKPKMKVAVFIGPEGGFDEREIEEAKNAGGRIISLGSRILRTETAAITATAMIMLAVEMKEGSDESFS